MDIKKSYGIILISDKKLLMIKRRNSIEYINLIRGNYRKENIKEYIHLITKEELNNLRTKNFNDIWEDLWGLYSINNYDKNIISSRDIFISNGINKIACNVNENLLYSNTEYTFPKGRKKKSENDIDCAMREFEEETGLKRSNVILTNNYIEEYFFGTDSCKYSTKYFICKLKNNVSINYNFTSEEVSKIELMSYNTCLKKIRPYRKELRGVIYNTINYL